MAPTEVEELKATVSKLEARVRELESRSSSGGSPGLREALRMILIGPPGAGLFHLCAVRQPY